MDGTHTANTKKYKIEGRRISSARVQKLRNYEFPPRVWLLKESNRSPLHETTFRPFFYFFIFFVVSSFCHFKRRRHRRPTANRCRRSLENFCFSFLLWKLFGNSLILGVIYLLATAAAANVSIGRLLYSNETTVYVQGGIELAREKFHEPLFLSNRFRIRKESKR